eukprot:TRINITY_DN16456_c0_g1_i1.p1 TRINITY_DN16456_c0_g1~~TRINITY_DN16456_c0_g1_i1.p1  ORF type:complete len:494 (+),score=129.15 TRINITY_DN16456_c0_g1_i1:56-1537(+)
MEKAKVGKRAECSQWVEKTLTLASRAKVAERDVVQHWERMIEIGSEVYTALKEAEMNVSGREKVDEDMRGKREKVESVLRNVRDEMAAPVKPSPHWAEESRRALKGADVQLSKQTSDQQTTMVYLSAEASRLEAELATLTRSIEAYEQEPPAQVHSALRSLSRSSSSRAQPPPSSQSVPKEVKAYDDFIAKHGRQGGWSNPDHAAFLKLRAEHPVDETLVTLLTLQTNRTVADTQKHIIFHNAHQKLLISKRTALDTWRKKKESDTMQNSLIKRRKDESEALLFTAQKRSQSAQLDYRKKQATALQAWKDDKIQKDNEGKHILQERQRVHEERKEREREKQQELREKVLQYKTEKEERRREAMAKRSSSVPQRGVSQEALISLRARDAEIVRQRKEAIKAADPALKLHERGEKQQQHLNSIKRPKAARDFSRLTQHTMATHLREADHLKSETEKAEMRKGDDVLVRGSRYTSPAPVKFTGKAVVAWCGSAHMC